MEQYLFHQVLDLFDVFPVGRSGTGRSFWLGENPKSFPACRKRLEIDDFSSILGDLDPGKELRT